MPPSPSFHSIRFQFNNLDHLQLSSKCHIHSLLLRVCSLWSTTFCDSILKKVELYSFTSERSGSFWMRSKMVGCWFMTGPTADANATSIDKTARRHDTVSMLFQNGISIEVTIQPVFGQTVRTHTEENRTHTHTHNNKHRTRRHQRSTHPAAHQQVVFW